MPPKEIPRGWQCQPIKHIISFAVATGDRYWVGIKNDQNNTLTNLDGSPHISFPSIIANEFHSTDNTRECMYFTVKGGPKISALDICDQDKHGFICRYQPSTPVAQSTWVDITGAGSALTLRWMTLAEGFLYWVYLFSCGVFSTKTWFKISSLLLIVLIDIGIGTLQFINHSIVLEEKIFTYFEEVKITKLKKVSISALFHLKSSKKRESQVKSSNKNPDSPLTSRHTDGWR